MEANVDAAGMVFSEGKEAEVTSDEEGFKGAWYAVTILKLPDKNNTHGKALVQHKYLLEDDNETPYTESVPLSQIRPLPPQPKVPGDQRFRVKDVVDAFYLDGWWTGSVSKVFDNRKRYIVTFEDPTEDVVFSSSDLRPHWKWVDGKWVQSSKLQEVLVPADCQKLVELSCNSNNKDAGTSVELGSGKKLEPCSVSSRKSEMSLSTASKEPGQSKHLKRSTIQGDATPSHPSKKSKNESSANSLVRGSKVKDTDPPKVEGVREEKFGFIRKLQRLLRFHVEGRLHPAADEMVEASSEVSEVQKMTKEAESSVSKELPIECMSGTMTEEESWHFIEEKELDVSRYKEEDGAKTGINKIEQPNVVLEIEQPKFVPRNSHSPSAGKDDAAGVHEEMFCEEQTAMEAESSAISGVEQAEGTAVASGTDCQREIIKMAGESGSILHETEEESPLICYKELQPGIQKSHSAVMDELNPGYIPHGLANQWNDPSEKSLEIVVQSPLVGMASDNERQELHALPFVKSLPMWKEVESMDIFQVMPQNPHFHPLAELKEILREGLAVGHMLNFASIVQKTSKLTVADRRNLFTSILDALPDFEILGFDIKAIRDRTSVLLLMKDRYEHLQDHSKDVKLQVKQYSDELTKINEEVDANYKKMRELEEKQALLLSMKETKTSQITTLQVSSDITTGDIQRVENDFESLAGSPW
ncbi:hypothetical protein PTKIN_Ptkin09bG0285400 [Pterospermum kingtungense]